MLGRLFTLLIVSQTLNGQAACPLKDGDLVFIKSQTPQSELLKLSSGSDWSHVGMAFRQTVGWEVIEAVQPVKWTSLYSFLRRSRQMHFEVRRAIFPFESAVVKGYAEKQLYQDYDLIFAWDDQRWYCSELVWKAYQHASGEQIGALERIGDLKVDNFKILKEARRRFHSYGMIFDEAVWKNYQVITPIQMMRSSQLQKVMDQKQVSSLKDCLFK